MLARQMRRAQLAELVLYAAFAAWLHGRGAALTACVLAVPALFLATRLAIVCSMFVLAWLYRAPRAPEERIGLARGIAMVLREYAAFLALNFLRTPWEDQALRPDPPCDAPGNTAIVLVHGYFANRACWSPMVAAIEAAGLGPVYVPSCRSHLASIERFVEDLDAAIARVSRGRRVVLVAHSMNGCTTDGAGRMRSRRATGSRRPLPWPASTPWPRISSSTAPPGCRFPRRS